MIISSVSECSKYILVSLHEVRCQVVFVVVIFLFVICWNGFRFAPKRAHITFKNELRKCSNSWKEFLFAASNSNLQLLNATAIRKGKNVYTVYAMECARSCIGETWIWNLGIADAAAVRCSFSSFVSGFVLTFSIAKFEKPLEYRTKNCILYGWCRCRCRCCCFWHPFFHFQCEQFLRMKFIFGMIQQLGVLERTIHKKKTKTKQKTNAMHFFVFRHKLSIPNGDRNASARIRIPNVVQIRTKLRLTLFFTLSLSLPRASVLCGNIKLHIFFLSLADRMMMQRNISSCQKENKYIKEWINVWMTAMRCAFWAHINTYTHRHTSY